MRLRDSRPAAIARRVPGAFKTLRDLAEPSADETRSKAAPVVLTVGSELKEVAGATIPNPFCYSVLFAAVAKASGSAGKEIIREALKSILGEIDDPMLRDRVAKGCRMPTQSAQTFTM